jgi:hypothetical protein
MGLEMGLEWLLGRKLLLVVLGLLGLCRVR